MCSPLHSTHLSFGGIYVFIYTLYNTAFSSSDYIVSGRMIVSNKLERTRNEVVVAEFKVYPSICLERLRNITKNIIKTAGLWAEI
jgi:hypothetical protein